MLSFRTTAAVAVTVAIAVALCVAPVSADDYKDEYAAETTAETTTIGGPVVQPKMYCPSADGSPKTFAGCEPGYVCPSSEKAEYCGYCGSKRVYATFASMCELKCSGFVEYDSCPSKDLMAKKLNTFIAACATQTSKDECGTAGGCIWSGDVNDDGDDEPPTMSPDGRPPPLGGDDTNPVGEQAAIDASCLRKAAGTCEVETKNGKSVCLERDLPAAKQGCAPFGSGDLIGGGGGRGGGGRARRQIPQRPTGAPGGLATNAPGGGGGRPTGPDAPEPPPANKEECEAKDWTWMEKECLGYTLCREIMATSGWTQDQCEAGGCYYISVGTCMMEISGRNGETVKRPTNPAKSEADCTGEKEEWVAGEETCDQFAPKTNDGDKDGDHDGDQDGDGDGDDSIDCGAAADDATACAAIGAADASGNPACAADPRYTEFKCMAYDPCTVPYFQLPEAERTYESCTSIGNCEFHDYSFDAEDGTRIINVHCQPPMGGFSDGKTTTDAPETEEEEEPTEEPGATPPPPPGPGGQTLTTRRRENNGPTTAPSVSCNSFGTETECLEKKTEDNQNLCAMQQRGRGACVKKTDANSTVSTVTDCACNTATCAFAGQNFQFDADICNQITADDGNNTCVFNAPDDSTKVCVTASCDSLFETDCTARPSQCTWDPDNTYCNNGGTGGNNNGDGKNNGDGNNGDGNNNNGGGKPTDAPKNCNNQDISSGACAAVPDCIVMTSPEAYACQATDADDKAMQATCGVLLSAACDQEAGCKYDKVKRFDFCAERYSCNTYSASFGGGRDMCLTAKRPLGSEDADLQSLGCHFCAGEGALGDNVCQVKTCLAATDDDRQGFDDDTITGMCVVPPSTKGADLLGKQEKGMQVSVTKCPGDPTRYKEYCPLETDSKKCGLYKNRCGEVACYAGAKVEQPCQSTPPTEEDMAEVENFKASLATCMDTNCGVANQCPTRDVGELKMRDPLWDSGELEYYMQVTAEHECLAKYVVCACKDKCKNLFQRTKLEGNGASICAEIGSDTHAKAVADKQAERDAAAADELKKQEEADKVEKELADNQAALAALRSDQADQAVIDAKEKEIADQKANKAAAADALAKAKEATDAAQKELDAAKTEQSNAGPNYDPNEDLDDDRILNADKTSNKGKGGVIGFLVVAILLAFAGVFAVVWLRKRNAANGLHKSSLMENQYQPGESTSDPTTPKEMAAAKRVAISEA